ncbi:MAG TPA: hypothetical protein ENG87_03980 [Candidatus Pacearchaeota archaeon]|nr:hypothetical protein [Candidatus Pacearchaeota archaeon]HDZ61190.1 hypothetical protein [Candidatus Pacearchaeota archaeon]
MTSFLQNKPIQKQEYGIGNLPKVMLGSEGISIQRASQTQNQAEYHPSHTKKPSPKPIPQYTEDPTFAKVRKWGLIICVVIVVGYATYRLFFG